MEQIGHTHRVLGTSKFVPKNGTKIRPRLLCCCCRLENYENTWGSVHIFWSLVMPHVSVTWEYPTPVTFWLAFLIPILHSILHAASATSTGASMDMRAYYYLQFCCWSRVGREGGCTSNPNRQIIVDNNISLSFGWTIATVGGGSNRYEYSVSV